MGLEVLKNIFFISEKIISDATTQGCSVKAALRHVNKWAWLCFNTILLIELGRRGVVVALACGPQFANLSATINPPGHL